MRIKLSDPALASSLPLRRTSEVIRSDNASCLMLHACLMPHTSPCLMLAWPRGTWVCLDYHADPFKSDGHVS